MSAIFRPVAPLSLPALWVRSCELFPGPDSTRLRVEWVRAVRVVRSTRRGWVLDRGSACPRWGHGYSDPVAGAKP